MQNRHSDIVQVVHDYLSDPGTDWVIGDGAVFTRQAEEEVETTLDHAGGLIVTENGAARIAVSGMTRLAPVERVQGRRWSRGALLCLREPDAGMPSRTALTELGSDMMAARPEDRIATLFDLGLGVAHADYCVRTADEALCALLREKAGSNVTGDAALWEAVQGADRVAVSRLGRIETFGGPPKCGSRLANLPAPTGYTTCMALIPPQQTEGAAFDDATYGAFRVLHGIFADLAHVRLKEAIFAGVRDGDDPTSLTMQDEEERMLMRVALHQLEWLDGASDSLKRWREALDA